MDSDQQTLYNLEYRKEYDGLYYVSIDLNNGFRKVDLGCLIRKEDGFFAWFNPQLGGNTYIEEWVLRDILNKLTELNKPISDSLEEYFRSNIIEEKEDKNWPRNENSWHQPPF